MKYGIDYSAATRRARDLWRHCDWWSGTRSDFVCAGYLHGVPVEVMLCEGGQGWRAVVGTTCGIVCATPFEALQRATWAAVMRGGGRRRRRLALNQVAHTLDAGAVGLRRTS